MSNNVTYNHVFVGLGKRNDKWLCKFDTWRMKQGDAPYVSFSAESAAVWDDEALALSAGRAAAVIANTTGKFPNMCEKW